jgi:hypothetical protein
LCLPGYLASQGKGVHEIKISCRQDNKHHISKFSSYKKAGDQAYYKNGEDIGKSQSKPTNGRKNPGRNEGTKGRDQKNDE